MVRQRARITCNTGYQPSGVDERQLTPACLANGSFAAGLRGLIPIRTGLCLISSVACAQPAVPPLAACRSPARSSESHALFWASPFHPSCMHTSIPCILQPLLGVCVADMTACRGDMPASQVRALHGPRTWTGLAAHCCLVQRHRQYLLQSRLQDGGAR
jgi:hypothetical protein